MYEVAVHQVVLWAKTPQNWDFRVMYLQQTSVSAFFPPELFVKSHSTGQKATYTHAVGPRLVWRSHTPTFVKYLIRCVIIINRSIYQYAPWSQ